MSCVIQVLTHSYPKKQQRESPGEGMGSGWGCGAAPCWGWEDEEGKRARDEAEIPGKTRILQLCRAVWDKQETLSLSFFQEMKLPHPRRFFPGLFSFLGIHGKFPMERRGSGGSHPTPIPGISWQGIFLAQSPEKLFQDFWGFFLGCSTLPAARPWLRGCRRGVGMAKIQKTCSFPILSEGEE